MTKKQLSEVFDQYPDVEFVVLDGLDEAIVGVVDRKLQPQPVLLYSVAKIIEILTGQMAQDLDQRVDLEDPDDDDPEELAWEWFSFNIEDAWMGDGTPAFLWDVPGEPKEPHP